MKNQPTTTNQNILIQQREDIINTFLNSIDISESTQAIYRKGTTYYINYLKKQNIAEPTLEDIKRYKIYLENNVKKSYSKTFISSLKRLYKFLYLHYGIKNITTEIKGIKDTDHKKNPLKIDEAKRLLAISKSNKRDYAIINLMLKGGLRQIEIQRANIEDLTIKNDKHILLVQGKGHKSKDDYIAISENTYTIISDYLATRKNTKPSDPLFTNEDFYHNGERLTTRSIRRIVKNYLFDIGIDEKKITTHSLRHTAITETLKNNGFNIYEAQQFARHTSPKTTEIYAGEITTEIAREKTINILDNVYN